jgi:16S rRNA processing protein RimM
MKGREEVMDSRLVLVAQVAGAFGVRGEVRVTAFTQDPANLLDYGPLLDASGKPVLTLLSGRADKGALVGRAREVATREDARAMRGLRLYIPRARLPAPGEDEFYLADLIGLAAVSTAGEALGRVKSVQNFGAGDLLEIEPPGGAATWWAPFTRAVVPDVRLAQGLLIVDRPAEVEDGSGETD